MQLLSQRLKQKCHSHYTPFASGRCIHELEVSSLDTKLDLQSSFQQPRMACSVKSQTSLPHPSHSQQLRLQPNGIQKHARPVRTLRSQH